MTVLRLVGGQDFKVKAPSVVNGPPKLVVPRATPGALAAEDTLRRHIMAQQIDGVSVRALIDEICECSQPYQGSTAALNRAFAIKRLLETVGIAALLSPDEFEESPVCATVFEPKKLIKAFPNLRPLSASPMSLALY